MSVQELAMRKYNNGLDSYYPVGSVIVNADCQFDSGKFVMKSLPANLPALFTLRFTAPEDFTQGNTISINGVDMSLRVPAMINASTAIFRAGAVFHVDIDMDREVAFAWQNQGGGGSGGSRPDLSFDEQFAGFHDVDGNRVYVKLVDFGRLPNYASPKQGANIRKPHNLVNIRDVVDFTPFFRSDDGDLYKYAIKGSGDAYCTICVTRTNIVVSNNLCDLSSIVLTVAMYYTCTDR